jgi:RNA methyltransferase, TrmH family
MPKAITSRENEYFRLARSLGATKGIRESGLFIIEGPKMLEEALETRAAIHSVTFDAGSIERFGVFISRCDERHIPTYTMPESMLQQVCDTETPQGVFALVTAPDFTLPDSLETLGNKVIALDGVQDPGNMGTILRCAAAFACSSILLGKGCANPLNPKTVRSCMGAIFHIPIYETDHLAAILGELKNQHYSTIAGHLAGSSEMPMQSDKTILVIGNESHGVSPEVASTCATLWRLHMPGEMESLNASVAAGIMMYELFARTE